MQKIMKNGLKTNGFLSKISTAVMYFILFAFFIILCGIEYKTAIHGGSFGSVLGFIGSLLCAIVFLIIFIASWEEIFEDEDEK